MGELSKIKGKSESNGRRRRGHFLSLSAGKKCSTRLQSKSHKTEYSERDFPIVGAITGKMGAADQATTKNVLHARFENRLSSPLFFPQPLSHTKILVHLNSGREREKERDCQATPPPPPSGVFK